MIIKYSYEIIEFIVMIIHFSLYVNILDDEPKFIQTYNRIIRLVVGLLFFLLFNPIKSISLYFKQILNIDHRILHRMTFSISLFLLTSVSIDAYNGL